MLGLHRHAIQRLRLQDVFASRLFTGVSPETLFDRLVCGRTSVDTFVEMHKNSVDRFFDMHSF